MNIFAFDDCPRLSALWLDDIRKNKMILESCQMLSHAMWVNHPNHNRDVYLPFNQIGYQKHGCTEWVCRSWANFAWLTEYLSICLEQRGKYHKCHDLLPHFEWFIGERDHFPEVYRTPFSNNAANSSVGVSYKHIANTNAAYRMYIRKRWELDSIKLTWNYGEKPWWS